MYIVRPVPTAKPSSPGSLGGRRPPKRRCVVAFLAAFTVARLALIPPVIATFMVHPAVTAACLGAFMFADLFDGVLARRFDADGPGRRALDSVTDRVAIDACLIGAWTTGAMPGLVLVGFLTRDLLCSALSTWMFCRRRAAIKADILYQGLSFLVGIWALAAPLLTQVQRAWTAILLLGFAFVVAADLARGVRRVVASPRDIEGTLIPAASLRARQDPRQADRPTCPRVA